MVGSAVTSSHRRCGVFYTRELFEQTAAGVKDGRVHIFPDWGHGRTASSSTTANLGLGFFLAALGM